ncbi:MAG: glycosyltransferase family 39 protein [Bacteroidia bacterium]|jgi:hypothetical protein
MAKQSTETKPKQKVVLPELSNTNQSKHLMIKGVILAYAFVLFSKSLNFPFITFDDPDYVVNNLLIRNFSLQGIWDILTTPVIGMYNPITFLVYMIEYQIAGLSPKTFHFFNIVFHLIATAFVYNFTYKLSKSYITAALVALLFAIHPTHVSVVTWVSQTKTSLFLIFYFSALISYLRYLEKPERKYLIYAGMYFLISVLSKPSAVTLAPMLILIDYYTGRKIDKRSLMEKIPFFIISLIFGIVNLYSHMEAEDAIFDVNDNYSLINNLLISNYSIVFYFKKLIFPFNFSTIYPYPDNTPILPLKYYLSIPVIPFLIWAVYKSGQFKKEMIFGLLFFVIAVSVLVKILPSGFFRAANRYTYLSYTGLFYIMGQFCTYVYDGKFKFSEKLKPYMFALLAFYLLFCTYKTSVRIDVWKDSVSLFTDVINKKPKLAMAYNLRALAKLETGDRQGAREDYMMAIKINPKYFEGYINLGIIDYSEGKFEEAMLNYDKGIRLNSTLGMGFHNRAILKMKTGDTLGAYNDWKKAIELNVPQAKRPFEDLSEIWDGGR